MPKKTKYTKLANGTGSVSKMAGNRRKPWRAVAPAVEDSEGNYRAKYIGCFATRQEALDALTLYRIAPPPDNADTTLDKLFTDWKAVAYKNIGKSSQEGYNAAWKHLAPIKKYKVRDIKTPQIQFCINRMEENGASFSSTHKVRLLASRLEDYAVQMDLKDKNYAKFVVVRQQEDEEKEIFSDIDLKKIEEAATNGVGVADLILIMCYTGWRIQEFCNLTRFSWDEKNGTLTGGLKTEAGKGRIVPVPDKVLPFLRVHLNRNQDKLFGYFNGTKFTPYTQKKLRTEFYNTLALLGIKPEKAEKFTPHVTRHTYNSLLFRSGVDVKLRMKLAGHSDMGTNLKTYTHADLEQLKKAVNSICVRSGSEQIRNK